MNRPFAIDVSPMNVPKNTDCDGRTAVERFSHANGTSTVVTPIAGEEVLRVLEPSPNIVMVKLDVEGFELNALKAMAVALPAVANMVMEISPAWWKRRAEGEQQVANLLPNGTSEAHFVAARTSNGCTFTTASGLASFIRRLGSNPYRYRAGQSDIWFSKNASLVQWAESRIVGDLGRPGTVAARRTVQCS